MTQAALTTMFFGILALLHFHNLLPHFVTDDSSWRNAAARFIVALTLIIGEGERKCNNAGISSVAHHNPHINGIFVNLFMQELFVDKIHFFKFFCVSYKPRLHQLNTITSSHSSTVQAFLIVWIFSFARGNTIKEGEIPYVENKYFVYSPTYQAC